MHPRLTDESHRQCNKIVPIVNTAIGNHLVVLNTFQGECLSIYDFKQFKSNKIATWKIIFGQKFDSKILIIVLLFFY